MRLGFDLDGVVTATHTHFIDKVNAKFNITLYEENVTEHDITLNTFSSNSKLDQNIKDYILGLFKSPQFYETIPEVAGAVFILKRLKYQGHKLFFVTSRDKQFSDVTAIWLKRHNVDFNDIALVGHTSKGFAAKSFNLDFFVDDLVDNLYEMYKFKQPWAKGLNLFTQPWNKWSTIDKSKFSRLDDWNTIYRKIQGSSMFK